MATSEERTLISHELVEIDGKKAMRLYFYLHMDGIIKSVIAFIDPEEVTIKNSVIESQYKQEGTDNLSEIQNALHRL